MLRVVTPLQKLKGEGGITLDAELAAVGRDKSFQCLLMEERAKVKREMACGVLGSVWGSPARSGRSASASPSPAPSPSLKAPSPPRGPVYVETGIQAEPETCDSTTMTNESMQMALTRSEIIEKQALEIDNLHAEVAELQKVLGGSPYDVLDYFRPMQQEWLLSQDLMQKEEDRQQAIFDAAAVINQRQFLREQRKVDRRTKRRTNRYQTVQGRIDDVKDQLLDRGIRTASPYGSPPRTLYP